MVNNPHFLVIFKYLTGVYKIKEMYFFSFITICNGFETVLQPVTNYLLLFTDILDANICYQH